MNWDDFADSVKLLVKEAGQSRAVTELENILQGS